MNPTKLLAEISSALDRHWPTIIVHLVLFGWISIRVIDASALPDGDTIWSDAMVRVEQSLAAVGAQLEPWYIVAALGIAYLAVFQWIRDFIVDLPVIRIHFDWRFPPVVLARASEVLRLQPETWIARDKLHDLVDRHAREADEKGESTPYGWLSERRERRNRYYGALVIALAAATAWLIEGAPYARSPDRVFELVVMLLLACLAARWTIAREGASAGEQLGFWALAEHERREPPSKPDPLGRMRYQLTQSQAEFQERFQRHPAAIVESWVQRAVRLFGRHKAIDDFLWEQLLKRLNLPSDWHLGQTWHVVASRSLTLADETQQPPAALRVDAFVERFTGLLECSGSGLCLLAPRHLGLAPAVDSASYCFAERQHGRHVLALALQTSEGLKGATLRARSDAGAYLAEVGEFPIERLVQGDFPTSREKKWWRVASARLDDENWQSLEDDGSVTVDGVTLRRSTTLKLGSSYILGARPQAGTSAAVALQCFATDDGQRLLVAWRIVAVDGSDEPPPVQGWWVPSAWRGLLRPERGTDRL